MYVCVSMCVWNCWRNFPFFIKLSWQNWQNLFENNWENVAYLSFDYRYSVLGEATVSISAVTANLKSVYMPSIFILKIAFKCSFFAFTYKFVIHSLRRESFGLGVGAALVPRVQSLRNVLSNTYEQKNISYSFQFPLLCLSNVSYIFSVQLVHLLPGIL